MNSQGSAPLRAVLVDFGGVLYRTPTPAWLPRLQKFLDRLWRSDSRKNGILLMLRASPRESQHVMDIMTGRIAEQAVWDELARAWRIHPALLSKLRESAYSPRRLNVELLDFLGRLRPRYRTAILTNAGTDFRQTFSRVFELETAVDQLIVSAEEGLAKPDPEIFRLSASRLGVLPEEAVMIDDLLENVRGAEQAGLRAILFHNTAQVIQELGKL
jgi:epoxide hydrolase-like predicted phosphatase